MIDHQRIKFFALNFASNEVFSKPKDHYSLKLKLFWGHWEHFHIFEKLGASLGRVFSAIWVEWVSGLCHCDQSPLGAQLEVETQLLRVTFWRKIWTYFFSNGIKVLTRWKLVQVSFLAWNVQKSQKQYTKTNQYLVISYFKFSFWLWYVALQLFKKIVCSWETKDNNLIFCQICGWVLF